MPEIHSALGEPVKVYHEDTAGLVLFASCAGAPPSTANEFAVGALVLDTVGGRLYINTGTSASPTWGIAASSGNSSPSHVVKYAGLSASETDSDASVVISVPGVLSTDVVLATIKAQAGTASILKAVPTTDTITVTLSGNGGAGTVVQYAVLRATS